MQGKSEMFSLPKFMVDSHMKDFPGRRELPEIEIGDYMVNGPDAYAGNRATKLPQNGKQELEDLDEAVAKLALLNVSNKDELDRMQVDFDGSSIFVKSIVGTKAYGKRLVDALTALIPFLPDEPGYHDK